MVARRISFWVANFASSRFRRSLSVRRVLEWASRLLSLDSRSLTWRSFRSRKARWLLERGRQLGMVVVKGNLDGNSVGCSLAGQGMAKEGGRKEPTRLDFGLSAGFERV